MPAFAEVAPVYYDDVIEYSDAEMFDGDVVVEEDFVQEEESKSVAAPNVSTRNANRSSSRATRNIPSAATAGATTRASATAPSRAVASRAAANISQTRNAMTRGTASRVLLLKMFLRVVLLQHRRQQLRVRVRPRLFRLILSIRLCIPVVSVCVRLVQRRFVRVFRLCV